uniref:Uncharacterized protein n=1 Tax=Chromera velia CCMP2878 TaxID=1169474 RepID=A0A0G4FQ49_9ALVE|eukprot:Cvel_18217.t1-p1 / transcript=Cvel_18217.t1 / gene=Cvel_18217 / organism=Chromera_velia_CCMP2878 / gene_product=hypothetical protein / transcript_product=hypothetical protein / location=Cvel_scaffold1496:34611-37048(-) / protein_length=319 / sequence_SO=supercontig / SO=protein_coding / is_pseudo=false
MKFLPVAFGAIAAEAALDKFDFGGLGKLGKFNFSSNGLLDGDKFAFDGLDLFGKADKGKAKKDICFSECEITLDTITWSGEMMTSEVAEGNNVISAFHSLENCGGDVEGTFTNSTEDEAFITEFTTDEPRPTTIFTNDGGAVFSSFLNETLEPFLAVGAWAVSTEGTLLGVTSGPSGDDELPNQLEFYLDGCPDLDAITVTQFCILSDPIESSLFPITQVEVTGANAPDTNLTVTPVTPTEEAEMKSKGFKYDAANKGQMAKAVFQFDQLDLFSPPDSEFCGDLGTPFLGTLTTVNGCCGGAAVFKNTFVLESEDRRRR